MTATPCKLVEAELEQTLPVLFESKCCGAPLRAALVTRHWSGHAMRVELTIACANCGHGHVACFNRVALVEVPR